MALGSGISAAQQIDGGANRGRRMALDASRWLSLCRRLNAKGDPAQAFAELSALYEGPHRAYHPRLWTRSRAGSTGGAVWCVAIRTWSLA